MGLKIEEIKSLVEYTEEYVKTTHKLYQLKAVRKSIDLASFITTRLFYIVLLCCSLFFLSIGLSIYLGELLNSLYLGFFIMSFVIFISSVVFSFFGYRWIKRIIGSILIHKIDLTEQ